MIFNFQRRSHDPELRLRLSVDNTTLNAGSGGDVIRTDDDGTAKWQYVKLAYGADNTQTLVTAANGLTVQPDSGGFTVTANLSATDNAVLDTIATNTTGLNGCVSGSELQVDIVSGNVTNAGTFAVQAAQSGSWTATATGAAAENAAVSGNPVLVGGRYDSSARTLGNGDAGAIALNASGHVIADISSYVDGTATDDAAFTAGTGTGAVMMGYATSDAVDAGDVGAIAMDTSRNLKVSIEADNAGIGGGTQYTEDVATANPIVGTAGMMERDDALSTLTPIEGDWAAFRCSAEGALWVQEFNSDAILADTASMDTNIGTIAGAVSGSEMQVDVLTMPTTTVTGTVTVNLGATDNAVLDVISANTERGSSHYRNVDANAEAAIKASAGVLHWVHAMNMTAAVAYLHLYDATAASVTPGTTTPDFTFPIPTAGDTNGAGFNLKLDQEFATAITLVVTTTIDGATGDPGTNGVFINAGYS